MAVRCSLLLAFFLLEALDGFFADTLLTFSHTTNKAHLLNKADTTVLLRAPHRDTTNSNSLFTCSNQPSLVAEAAAVPPVADAWPQSCAVAVPKTVWT